jgi:hypothetical protein
MKPTNTPVPWRIEPIEHGFVIGHSDGELRSHVAYLYWNALCEEHGDIEANARLIASAPELLAALEAITKAYVELVESDYAPCWNAENDEEVISARAIIAKAKGN